MIERDKLIHFDENFYCFENEVFNILVNNDEMFKIIDNNRGTEKLYSTLDVMNVLMQTIKLKGKENMRISSRCIIFAKDQILLIYRERENESYYVFPGGKIEEDETKEDCIIRECREELGVTIKVKKYLYKVMGKNFIQHFFLCEWISGELGTGDEEEYSVNRKGGLQVPVLIDIGKLKELNIVSKPIVNQLLEDINNYGLDLDNNSKEIEE